MHKNTYTKLSKTFLDYAGKTKSWHPVERNGWVVKFSCFRNSNILLFVISQYTGQTLVRYFSDEDEAVMFINFIIQLDPAQEHDL
jgi:hypothetical protein